MIKKFLLIAIVTIGLSSHAQTTLNSTITSSQTVQDPVHVRMLPGFNVLSSPNLTFTARIGNNTGNATAVINSNCEKYGKIVISEIHFDTHYNEKIESKYHYFGEYIELYNSSNVPVDLNGG